MSWVRARDELLMQLQIVKVSVAPPEAVLFDGQEVGASLKDGLGMGIMAGTPGSWSVLLHLRRTRKPLARIMMSLHVVWRMASNRWGLDGAKLLCRRKSKNPEWRRLWEQSQWRQDYHKLNICWTKYPAWLVIFVPENCSWSKAKHQLVIKVRQCWGL